MKIARITAFAFLGLFASTVLLHAQTCSGSSPTWTASPDYDSVSACAARAGSGDTVKVSAGKAVWTSTLSITKGLSLIGSGRDQTFISGTIVLIKTDTPEYTRISGFDFQGGRMDGAPGMLQVANSPKQFRIDHNRFSNPTMNPKRPDVSSTRGITVAHAYLPDQKHVAYGVIDHNLFSGDPKPFPGILVGADDKTAWTRDSVIGTVSAVYIEDNVWHNPTYVRGAMAAIDSGMGGAWVARHNKVTNGDFAAHEDNGARPPTRSSTRSWEIYSNTFINNVPGGGPASSSFSKLILRGGTGVVWGNTFVCEMTGCQNPYSLSVYRGDNGGQGAGAEATACDGSNPYDGNFVFGKAVHAGNGGTSFEAAPSVVSWAADQWKGYRAYNVTDGSNCLVTASGPNTLTCARALEKGTRNTWARGDRMELRTGWPCWGQIGRGKITAANPAGEPEPTYIWDNVCRGPWARMRCVNEMPAAYLLMPSATARTPIVHVEKGRDFFEGMRRPGYAPSPYPHPLVKRGE